MTRTFTLVYTLSLLTILTRIQLNLLGRRSYLSSVVTLASYPLDASEISLENREDGRFDEHAYGGGDFEANRRYLAFSWWLLQRGWRENMHKVEAAVKDVFGPVDPREDIPMARLSELTLQVRRQVEGATQLERRYVRIPCSTLIDLFLHLGPVLRLNPKNENFSPIRESLTALVDFFQDEQVAWISTSSS